MKAIVSVMTDVASHYFRDVYFQCFRVLLAAISPGKPALSPEAAQGFFYEEFWSYDAANEASFYIFSRPFFLVVLTILTSSMLEKLRTKMLTWTRVAESGKKTRT